MRYATPAALVILPLALGLAACGGSSGGGGEPPVAPNEAPVLTAPVGLTGGPVQFRYTLPTTGASSLTFTGTDSDGDALLWQVAVSASGATGAGLSYASPATGSTFRIDLAVVTAPSVATMNVLVEDTKGAAAAIDILLVRSGSPTVTSVEPGRAFASAPQQVAIHGSSFALGSTVDTRPSFGGIVGTDIVVVDESTLTCATPATLAVGPQAVGVSNQFGAATAPAGSFTAYAYPVDLLDADTAMDAGAGGSLVAANDGALLQNVWIEGGALQHRQSVDGGENWSAIQTLTSGDTPTEPEITIAGSDVTVVWISDGNGVVSRSSSDGGVVFDSAVPVSSVAVGQFLARPLVVQSGVRRYCAWLQGNPSLGEQRVWVAVSSTAGALWTTPKVASVSTLVSTFQRSHALGCDGSVAWLAYYTADAQGSGIYTSRTDDGGLLWTQGVRRGAEVAAVTDVLTCHDGDIVHVVWAANGQLGYMTSENLALGWPTQAITLRDGTAGALSQPVITCEGERLFAAYLVGGTTVAVTRVGGIGVVPQSVDVSDVVESAGGPQIAVRGNYAFVAWRGGSVAGGAARIKLATSVDVALTFAAPAGFGDGTASQDLPQMLLEEARIWMGWLDSRGATPALFENRTER